MQGITQKKEGKKITERLEERGREENAYRKEKREHKELCHKKKKEENDRWEKKAIETRRESDI